MRKFGLELHPDKTRLIEFGRHAARNRKQRGERKPKTFDFIGFTHLCGKTSKRGHFMVLRKTVGKRIRAKLQQIKQLPLARKHDPVQQTGEWLRTVVQGYFNYHAVPGNGRRMGKFREQVARYWRLALRRRSQKSRTTWDRFRPLAQRWIPVTPQVMRHFALHDVIVLLSGEGFVLGDLDMQSRKAIDVPSQQMPERQARRSVMRDPLPRRHAVGRLPASRSGVRQRLRPSAGSPPAFGARHRHQKFHRHLRQNLALAHLPLVHFRQNLRPRQPLRSQLTLQSNRRANSSSP